MTRACQAGQETETLKQRPAEEKGLWVWEEFLFTDPSTCCVHLAGGGGRSLRLLQEPQNLTLTG